MKKALLIDGYLDEPAVLGVPPYISPYIRYIYGALLLKGFFVEYLTIDSLRELENWKFDHEIIVIYGGTTVPGHYLSATPMTLHEAKKIINENKSSRVLIGGPITHAYTLKGGSKAIEPQLDGAEVVKSGIWNYILTGDESEDYDLIKDVAVIGAELVKIHPFFPNVICELEISKGCERKNFCSFCTEPILHGNLVSRPVDDIVNEVRELYKAGCKAFRLGRSANILAYMSDKNGLKPSPQALEELYYGIRKAAPNLEVLHTDNANPSYIVKYLPETSKIIEIIAKYNTPGDTLSFGVESFDQDVLKKNNIGSSPGEVIEAIRLVNEIGGFRVDGVPKLLPGINLLFGLIGESEKTYEENFRYLKHILESGFLLRRINIRQVMVYPGTPLYRYYTLRKFKINKVLFKRWKDKIRREIDAPMIKKVFPKGAIIRGVIPEKRRGKITFGRPLGTYPILVGTYSSISGKNDMIVVNHGIRSVTAVKYPFDINSASYDELVSIEGMGKSRAEEVIMKRPFKDLGDIRKRLNPETYEALKELLEVL